MDNNWIVDNLENALTTWNDKLAEMWTLLTESPPDLWGRHDLEYGNDHQWSHASHRLRTAGAIPCHQHFQKLCNLPGLSAPGYVFKHFIYFILAKLGITYGMDLMVNIFDVCNGIVATAASSVGGITNASAALPPEIITAIEDVGFLASIPLWLVTLLGSLFMSTSRFMRTASPACTGSRGRRGQNPDTQSVIISGVDLRKDEWVHVAFTFDETTDTVKCYLNGALVSTVDNCTFNPVIPAQALKVGGDYRGTGSKTLDGSYNNQYFKGEIANISIWSSVRTDEQIEADVTSLKTGTVNTSGDGLLSAWSFQEPEAPIFRDLSANENNVADFVGLARPGLCQGRLFHGCPAGYPVPLPEP